MSDQPTAMTSEMQHGRPGEPQSQPPILSQRASASPKRWAAAVLLLTVGGFLALGIISSKILFLLALFAAIVLVFRQLICWRVRFRAKLVTLVGSVALLSLAVGVAGSLYISHRYAITAVMEVPITEYGNAQYPEDPAHLSIHYGNYNGRKLTLVQKDATHFDFVLTPLHPYIAKVEIRNVDVSLMTPSLPAWAKEDAGLRRIALTDRQWNRQQVRFDAGSPHIEITGGDGIEKANIYSVELAKNCLNAGLWEILLFERDKGDKALYYHDWFTFPLGHYKSIFEHNTGFAYWRDWYFLEHWSDPTGTKVPLEKLRKVVEEHEVPAKFDRNEPVIGADGRHPRLERLLRWPRRATGFLRSARKVQCERTARHSVHPVGSLRESDPAQDSVTRHERTARRTGTGLFEQQATG